MRLPIISFQDNLIKIVYSASFQKGKKLKTRRVLYY
jgi:hypothetical protein